MKSIAIPLRVKKGGLSRIENTKKAIDSALNLLTTTPCLSCLADPQYGFIFNNLRFEIFNESDGVVFNPSGSQAFPDGWGDLYEKKISGSSNNLDTFAAELKQSILRYEKRLKDVSVTMNYVQEARKIEVSVMGVIVESEEPYQYQSIINVWN